MFEQYRSVNIAGNDVSELHMSVKVSRPKDDAGEFDITVFNLTQSTWSSISKGDLVKVELGWADGKRDTVIKGEIDKRNRQFGSGDQQFIVKGTAKTDAELTDTRFSASYKDADPAAIAASIASEAGLLSTTTAVGQPLSGLWSITTDKNAKHWLDELIEYAAEFTGKKWRWFVEREELFFIPLGEPAGSAPKLSYDGNLVSISEKDTSDKEEDSSQQLDFEAMLDPSYRKGTRVQVATDRFSGAYECKTYEYQTDTDSGEHLVRGTLEALDGNNQHESETSS